MILTAQILIQLPQKVIEYGAKVFGKTIAEAGLQLGENAQGFGNLANMFGNGGINFFDNMLTNTNIDVELQEDGDVKTEGFTRFFVSNITWAVDGEYVILNVENNQPTKLKIISHDDKGFTAEYEKFLITARRK
jgi:hypothetical protein